MKPEKPTLTSWYRRRGYVHFDRPLSEAAAIKLATIPHKVSSHSFYPFLSYAVTTQKIEKNAASGHVTYKDPKVRPIAYAAHSDSHIYSYYCHSLSVNYESKLTHNSLVNEILAFRSLGKSNINFANEAFETIKKLGECSAFTTDISGFFDNLDHKLLKKAWSTVLDSASLPSDHYAVFKSLTKFSKVDLQQLYDLLGYSKHNPPRYPSRLCSPEDFRSKVRTSGLIKVNTERKGIPQGAPLSALLSNIYLLDFDLQLKEEINQREGSYRRYCDDILCIVPSGKAEGLYEFVAKLIDNYKLEINEKKTSTHTFFKKNGKLTVNQPLQYLGFIFDGERKLIRSAAFARFSEKMKRGISLAKQTAISRRNYPYKGKEIWKCKLYERYSHLGRRNFIRYGLKSASIMDSKNIKRQLRPLWRKLNQRIQKANYELIK